ncbi:spherulation-specific family 4 protein [Streptomyces pathocidini]|uniref:Spherulation-specific family 4 protein n=1 Tax=Streptomyces pathocidini TaxID=1650571 RepID=A0ABW7UQJ2_9ACTN|nr:spherulation-specific family 4 protein [Streptomyces pathocidini]
MSHLIDAGPRLAATAGASSLGVGVPGYAHPLVAPAEWAELARPEAPLHWAVLNVARGPGIQPDPHCLEAAGRLTNAGVRVLGLLDTRLGTRPFGELISDAHHFLDWYKVDGFYLDRCPPDRAVLQETKRVAATLRALLEEAYLVFGHGTHPYPGYAEWADQLVTFAGSWADYRWSQVAEWTAEYAPQRFCHLVHGVPRLHLEEAVRIARWQGAGTVYFTDRTARGRGADPWEALPGYWDEIVSRIGPGVSE